MVLTIQCSISGDGTTLGVATNDDTSHAASSLSCPFDQVCDPANILLVVGWGIEEDIAFRGKASSEVWNKTLQRPRYRGANQAREGALCAYGICNWVKHIL